MAGTNTIRDVISSLLGQIPSLFSKIKNPEPALLPAINAALSALQSTGGKVVCAISSLPTWGPGRLVMREDPKAHGTENERKLFATEQPGWKKTATKLAESGIGVDFFIAAPGGAYMDVATIGKYRYYSAMHSLLLTISRPCRCGHWWRNVLLSQLPCAKGCSEALEGDRPYRQPRNRLPGVDEGPLLERPPSLFVSRKLLATHLRCGS